MAKAKKDAAYLNVYIERTTLERLNKFCEEIGGNKSVTTDKAINRYIDEMEKKLKKGDTIQCADVDDLIDTMTELAKNGVITLASA